MPIGHLLDQWEIYKQFNGMVKPKKENPIDSDTFRYLIVIKFMHFFKKYFLF